MPALEIISRDLHQVILGGASIDYVLLRKRGRRGISLKVDESGLTVNAPASASMARIEALLRDSERWVKRKIEEWGTRRIAPASWADGASVLFLGQGHVLRLEDAARARVELGDRELRIAVPSRDDETIKRAVTAWYKRAALAHFAHRTFVLARLGGLAPPRVFVSSALARWGSCNSRREIRLTWRLVKARPALIDYVVCHELAHLRHMNHSPAFWSEVERLCPEYPSLRDELEATDYLYRSF